MADQPEYGAHLRIIPLDTGRFEVSASVDGDALFEATVPAEQLAEASAAAGRAVVSYLVEQLRENAGTMTLGRLLGWE